MTPIAAPRITVNGRTYHTAARPYVVICLDGSSDEYFNIALASHKMPNLERIQQEGHRGVARGVLPSLTNPNNASIVTGVPPSIHGICGNYFYDTSTDCEVMMNSGRFLRSSTIPAAAAQAGRKTAVITAKEKLRDILGHGLGAGIAFSSERGAEALGIANIETLIGLPAPDIYSAEASLYVLHAGAALLRNGLADFLYLSTTDYVQHTADPNSPAALNFYASIDVEIGRLCQLGAVVGLTADHGMNSKQKPDGSPNVIFLEAVLHREFRFQARVILPINDPYVLHHGSLGSFAMIHLPEPAMIAKVQDRLLAEPGITEVYTRETAAAVLQLPSDRIGDLVVLSRHDVVLGRAPRHHDLSALQHALRSHGGRAESIVPFIISEPLNQKYQNKLAQDPRNFDIFDFTINGTLPSDLDS